MPFHSPHSQSDPTLCSECATVGSHSPTCTRFEPAPVLVPWGYDYSHLVGDRAHQPDDRVSATVSFDELLTPEDRIFLEFGLRIAL